MMHPIACAVAECVDIAITNFKTRDLPAVIAYDRHANLFFIESLGRFVEKAALEPERFAVLLRVQNDFSRAVSMVDCVTHCTNTTIVDIYADRASRIG